MRSEQNLLQQWQHKFVERIAVWGNRYMYKPQIRWTVDHSWLQPYLPYMQHDPAIRRPQVRKLDRRFVLIEFARYVRHLSGSTAECGVARGVGSALICKALEGTYDNDERHFGFDAFAGLPQPDPIDRMTTGGRGWRKGELLHDGSLAKELFAEFEQAELRIGWIPETFTGLESHQFRFIHIDVDLYRATRDSLEFLFPRMVSGGVVLLDDHGMTTCPGARQAALDYFATVNEQVVDLPTGQGLVIKSG